MIVERLWIIVKGLLKDKDKDKDKDWLLEIIKDYDQRLKDC